jgi:hypothetical protein
MEKSPQNVGNFLNFHKTEQSKQSANGRKLAQSGHPADGYSAGKRGKRKSRK